MSTRRSARAASKPLSDVSAASSATPRTPRRTSSRLAGPLPAIGTRTSNAYGTNNSVVSGRADAPEVANQVGDVIDNLIGAGATPARKRRGTSQVSSARGSRAASQSVVEADTSRSFQNESGIFGEAHLESSINSPNLSMIEEEGDSEKESRPIFPPPQTFNTRSRQPNLHEPEKRPQQQTQHQAQKQAIEEVARATRIQQDPAPWKLPDWALDIKDTASEKIAQIGPDGRLIWKYVFYILAALSVVVLAIMIASASGIRYYGMSSAGMKHNVKQFIPFTDRFAPADIHSLQKRMSKAEGDILLLQQRPTLDTRTIKKLEQMLPDLVVVKKGSNGRLVIPNDLWESIRTKIQADSTLVFGDKPMGDSAMSYKQIEAAVGQAADKFFKSNEIKQKIIDSRFSRLLDNAKNTHEVISKEDAIALIRDSYDDHQDSIKKDITKIHREFAQLTKDVSAHTDALAPARLEEVFKRFLPNAQLAALSRANQASNINYGATKFNHFSIGTGAIINANHVSPTYNFKDREVSLYKRTLLWFDGIRRPTPKAPVEALMRWEEHGDCWCSPAKNDGFGPSLAVITGDDVYPEEVVIEHVHRNAALEPGATPRDMELLAFIPDRNQYEAALKLSNELFTNEQVYDQLVQEDCLRASLPSGYVRIGSWTYDSEREENVQAFDVQLDLKMLGVVTHQFIVRAKNNWGSAEFTCFYRVRLHGGVPEKKKAVS